MALLRAALPTWGGMGLGPQPRALRVVAGAGTALAGERDDLLHRLLALCRSVPDECPDEAAAVCTVAAHVAWVGGDGAIARAAVDRALRLAPDYRLAQLLERLVETGLRLPPVEPAAGQSRRAAPRDRPADAVCSALGTPPVPRCGAGSMDAGHESQCQTPVCWAATLLAVGCPG